MAIACAVAALPSVWRVYGEQRGDRDLGMMWFLYGYYLIPLFVAMVSDVARKQRLAE